VIEQLPFLFWPFMALLAIAAIHVYLGLHVVERGVIFVDLSLAQVAVLGAAIATLFGHDTHDPITLAFALGFTVIGATMFSLTRSEHGQVPQEAIIGIVYAVSAAATVLILNNAPHGAEHIRDVLVGQLLAVGPDDVRRLVVAYAVIGALHLWWASRLLQISRDPEGARTRGLRVKLWDFAFYVTFGLTVALSVELAGVLVVFIYLIVPSVTAMLLAHSVPARLALGWGVAITGSVLGILLSVGISAPLGASVVCAFGGLLAIVAGAKAILRR
jgi:zinc/manganese transport system permease protein